MIDNSEIRNPMWRRVVDRLSRVPSVRKLRWFRLRPLLYGFTYHRIGDAAACPFDRGVFCGTQDDFRRHVEFLRRRFDVVGADRLVAMQKSGETPKRPTAVITFDDGYVDNYELVFPVLKETGTTAVFYPPTAYVDSAIIPWWDEIAWTLRNATAPSLRLAGSEIEHPLNPEVMERSIYRTLQFVKSRVTIPMDEQLGEIREACAPKSSIRDLNPKLFINWDQLKEMSDSGMDVGSHTHSHEILSHLDAETQRREMAESKEILESRLGRPIDTIAYPVGSRVAFTEETRRLAREVGYALGFNFIAGDNPMPFVDPFDVYRYESVY